MSIGIVFRSTMHSTEVQKDSGLVVLDENNELKMFGNNEKRIEKKAKTQDEVEKEMLMFKKRNDLLIDYFAGNAIQ